MLSKSSSGNLGRILVESWLNLESWSFIPFDHFHHPHPLHICFRWRPAMSPEMQMCAHSGHVYTSHCPEIVGTHTNLIVSSDSYSCVHSFVYFHGFSKIIDFEFRLLILIKLFIPSVFSLVLEGFEPYKCLILSFFLIFFFRKSVHA